MKGQRFRLSSRLKYLILTVWILFTLSLAGWLFYFSYEQIARLQALGGEEMVDAVRYQRMLLWESTVLFTSLLGGALVIALYMFRDQERSRKLKNFFLTFTHELKTPLASIQLQAESLAEDLGESQHKSLIERLRSDTNSLGIQLENSLFLAEADAGEFHFQKISLPQDISHLTLAWPSLAVEIHGEATVNADKRAFESIVRNILKNAVDHGRASRMRIDISTEAESVRLLFKDNGSGFSGDPKVLGKLFVRPYSGSGNGIGLHLIERLITRMGGVIKFPETKPNFAIKIELPASGLS